ncbi:MAG: thioredoxin family protein [Phycisphaerales bacterium]|nr:thioredoxin family protein [Phycisphaerales bacterium]
MKTLTIAAAVTLAAGSVLAGEPSKQPADRSAAAKAPIELRPVLPSEAGRSLPWSPRGTQMQWSDQLPDHWPEQIRSFASSLIDPVYGEMAIGPDHAAKRPFILARTSDANPHREILVIDANADGRIDTDREVFTAEARDVRGRMWVTHAPVTLAIDYTPKPEEKDEERDRRAERRDLVEHEFSFWHTYPREGDEESNILRYTRRSWMEGEVSLLGRSFRLQVIDANNDALYTTSARWTLAPVGPAPERPDEADDPAATFTTEARTGIGINDPFFIDGQAYRLSSICMSGRTGAFKAADDAPVIPDRPAEPDRPKSEHELAWIGDLDEAQREAQRLGKPLLVKWTAVWCGPCRTMDREAYRDKAVVETLRGSFVIASIDFDEQHQLARQHSVRALPTIQIFDPSGEEVDRRVGLQTPVRMEAWLDEHKGRARGS